MSTGIIVSHRISALHQWPSAREVVPLSGFLADWHFHTFKFVVYIETNVPDRGIEFILYSKKVLEPEVRRLFTWPGKDAKDFAHPRTTDSCETLAERLSYYLSNTTCLAEPPGIIVRVEVWEDENFGGYWQLTR